jgi:hypothetical protein
MTTISRMLIREGLNLERLERSHCIHNNLLKINVEWRIQRVFINPMREIAPLRVFKKRVFNRDLNQLRRLELTWLDRLGIYHLKELEIVSQVIREIKILRWNSSSI